MSNVLVIGATGTLGFNIVKGLTDAQYKDKFNVFVLIRKETIESKEDKKSKQIKEFQSLNVKVVAGDLKVDEEKQLAEILANHHINSIVSAVNYELFEEQIKLLNAAKAANVTTFVPSDFGSDVSKFEDLATVLPVLLTKVKVLEAVKSSGLKWLSFASGFFTEYVVTPFAGVDIPNATVTAPESFDKKFTTTSLKNIGLDVAHALASNTRNEHILLGDSTVTWEELAQAVEAATGKTFQRKTTSLQGFQDRIKANPYDFPARFGVVSIRQAGVHWPVENSYGHKVSKHYTEFKQSIKNALSHQ